MEMDKAFLKDSIKYGRVGANKGVCLRSPICIRVWQLFYDHRALDTAKGEVLDVTLLIEVRLLKVSVHREQSNKNIL